MLAGICVEHVAFHISHFTFHAHFTSGTIDIFNMQYDLSDQCDLYNVVNPVPLNSKKNIKD